MNFNEIVNKKLCDILYIKILHKMSHNYSWCCAGKHNNYLMYLMYNVMNNNIL